MTPSGGARNPFEAYALVRNVTGLAEGLYHYSGVGHSLQRLGDLDDTLPSQLLGSQDWVDGAACIVFFVSKSIHSCNDSTCQMCT